MLIINSNFIQEPARLRRTDVFLVRQPLLVPMFTPQSQITGPCSEPNNGAPNAHTPYSRTCEYITLPVIGTLQRWSKIILDDPVGPHIITHILRRGRQEGQRQREKRKDGIRNQRRGWCRDAGFGHGGKAHKPGMQKACGSWTRQGNEFSVISSRRGVACSPWF